MRNASLRIRDVFHETETVSLDSLELRRSAEIRYRVEVLDEDKKKTDPFRAVTKSAVGYASE